LSGFYQEDSLFFVAGLKGPLPISAEANLIFESRIVRVYLPFFSLLLQRKETKEGNTKICCRTHLPRRPRIFVTLTRIFHFAVSINDCCEFSHAAIGLRLSP
jgi:hypothetical protein